MASNSEVGHAKNIAHFNLLNTHIAGLGAIYNPSNTKLYLTNLQAAYTTVSGQQLDFNARSAPYSFAVDAREELFAPLNPNLTRLQKAYKATEGVTAAHIEDLRSIVFKIKGLRNKKAPQPTPDEPAPNQISVSQLSYDQRTNNMDLLISLLQNTPNYAPNEADYTVAYYKDQKQQMLLKTQEVANTFIPFNNARSLRNHTLYEASDNIIGLAEKTKAYIATILPKSSPQYKAIAAIKFKRP